MRLGKVLVLVVYLVILAQFLFSNFVFVLGPHYVQPVCSAQSLCISSCYTNDLPPPADQSKGFPFATNEYQPYTGGSCAFGGPPTEASSYPINDFTHLGLNVLYMLIVTSLLIFFLRLSRHTKP
jgi:hypothetical protein